MRFILSVSSKILIIFQVRSFTTCPLHKNRKLNPIAHPRLWIFQIVSLNLPHGTHLSFFNLFLECCSIDYMVSKKTNQATVKSEKDFEDNKYIIKQ